MENELNRQHIELLEKQNAVYVLVSVAVLFLILLVFSIYFYRRKHNLYKTIVANMTESAREEQRLRDTINRLEDELQNVKKGTGAVEGFPEVYGDKDSKDFTITSEGKDDTPATSAPDEDAEAADGFENEPKESGDNSTIPPELYRRLRIDFERLMTDKSVYTDNLITKEKIARRLGTNRTYFSRFINDCYKMSFTRLVNSFRIKEAVRLLSDPDISLPLKTISEQLGFNSQSTFYSQFQEATGMTPAAFRNKACRLPNL